MAVVLDQTVAAHVTSTRKKYVLDGKISAALSAEVQRIVCESFCAHFDNSISHMLKSK